MSAKKYDILMLVLYSIIVVLNVTLAVLNYSKEGTPSLIVAIIWTVAAVLNFTATILFACDLHREIEMERLLNE